MQEKDLDKVIEIQSQSYRSILHESKTVFAEKLHLFPAGCWIAYMDSKPAAYLFSHPWYQSAIIELNTRLNRLPDNPDCYYIHDLSVSPIFHRCGIGQKMGLKAIELAISLGFRTLVLVAVQNSQAFWTKLGFHPVQDPSGNIQTRLFSSYGQDACLMMSDHL